MDFLKHSKQKKFRSYLDDQRRFRWSLKGDLEEFEYRLAKYTDLITPKENVNCARCREFPVDAKVEDVKNVRGHCVISVIA